MGIAVDPLGDPRWDELVDRAPEGSIFHHSRWLRLLGSTYGYELTACCVASGDGTLLAGLPVAAVSSRLSGRRLVALPFSDLCPPLVRLDAPPGASLALESALGGLQRSRGVPLEVRGTGAVLAQARSGECFHHHVLALDGGVDAVRGRFAKSQVMRGVRRAVRAGLHAERRTDREALAAFFRLHVHTRRRLGVPTQPRKFILGLEELFAHGLGFVLLVRHDERAVAGGVFLTQGEVLTYKYGASDARLLSLRPNNLMFMEAIGWACEHGYRRLDFGRTHWGQDGLRAFKLSWGAEERELRYRLVGGAEPGGRNPHAQRLLAAIIRRSPPMAGRLIGEALYRHAG